MRKVKVTVTKPDGTVLGSAALVNNLVSLYPKTYKGPIILEFADDGSGGGEYFDEAKKAWINLAGQKLHVLIPALTHHVSANPLTEAAYQYALTTFGTSAPLTAAQMTTANNTVLAAFNARTPAQYAITDITNYAEAVGDTTTAGTLPNTHAGRYGTLLASLPRAATEFNPGLAAPALSFTAQLVKDVKDDGTVNASVASTEQTAYGPGISQSLATAVVSAKTDYASPAQPTPITAPSTCFNPALYVVGSKQVLNYRNTNSGGSVTSETYTTEIMRQTTFEGFPALELKFTSVGAGSDDALTFSYYSPDLSNGYIAYGTNVTLGGNLGSMKILFNPPIRNRLFLLKPGESDTRSISATSTSYDASGAIIFGPTSVSITQIDKFIGYEDVTVPAGTFRGTCKFQTDDGQGEVTTQWFSSSGEGVQVKSTSTGSFGYTSELISGTFNGKPVR